MPDFLLPALRQHLAPACALLALSLPCLSAAATADSRQQLAAVPVFAMGYVGFVSHISDGEQIFRQVLVLPDARTAFNDIVFSPFATPEAKTYALCGLHDIANEDFAAAARFVQPSHMEVSVLRVDILRKEKLNDLLKVMAVRGCAEAT